MAVLALCLLPAALASRSPDLRGNKASALQQEPVTAPAAATQPKMVDLVSRVADKLKENHANLLGISQELLGVQGDVSKTEQSLLGRIVDTNSAKTILARHEQVDTANSVARSNINVLNDQVEGLSHQLADAQKEYETTGESQRKMEGELTAKAAEDDEAIKKVKIDLDNWASLAGRKEQVAMQHEFLLKELKNITDTHDKTRTQIAQTDVLSEEEVKKHARFKSSVEQMHNYGLDCSARVDQLAKDIAMARDLEPKETAAAAAAKRHEETQAKVTMQRLMAERALLRAEVEEEERHTHQALDALQTVTTKFKTLQENIVAEVRLLEKQKTAAEFRTNKAYHSIQDNDAKNEIDCAHEQSTKHAEHTLENEMSDVVKHALHAENEAYASEKTQALKFLEESKEAEARAWAGAQQAKAEAAAKAKMVAEQEKAVMEASQLGKAGLEEAVKESSDMKKDSMKQIIGADEAEKKRCRTDWEKIVSDTDSQLQQCEVEKENLAAQKAQVDALKSTLTAQETAGSMSDE